MIQIKDSNQTSCTSCTIEDRRAAELEIGRPLNYYDIHFQGSRVTVIPICEPCLISLNEETSNLVEV